MAEAVKMERLVEAVQVGRLAEAVKAVRLAEAVRVGRLAVAVKILNCLICLILLSVTAMASLTGAVLNPMAISEHLGHLLLLVQVELVRKI
ncbi:hypothetical protein [Neisseria subflava]|nr:hypothetical protein [Neisseria subflava]MCL9777723.1 hypothetical protein [Neisseria subflava]